MTTRKSHAHLENPSTSSGRATDPSSSTQSSISQEFLKDGSESHKSEMMSSTQNSETSISDAVLTKSDISTIGNVSVFEEPLTDYLRELPPELRLHIFQYVLPGPRVVEVSEGDRLSEENCENEASVSSWTWTRRAPVLLHINQEWRAEAKKLYNLVSIDELRGRDPEHSKKSPVMIYFNFELDTLYISAATLRKMNPFAVPDSRSLEVTTGLERVKHLALDTISFLTCFTVNGNHFCQISNIEYLRIINRYKSLETLSLMRDWSAWNSRHWRITGECGRGSWTDPMPTLGPSLSRLCHIERGIMMAIESGFRGLRPMAAVHSEYNPQSLHPTILQLSYFGSGTFTSSYGVHMSRDEEGPRQEKDLKGLEAELLPEDIKMGLVILRLAQEEYGRMPVHRNSDIIVSYW